MTIIAENITKTFGAFTALDNLSIDVADGHLVSLIGPSGSGKNTLLRILAGLEFSDEGCGAEILFHGEDVTDLPAGRRGVLYVRPRDVDIEPRGTSAHEFALTARVRHIFSAGNYGRISLERSDTLEPFEAELSRSRLDALGIAVGDEVDVVFRHIRLSAGENYQEQDFV